MTTTYTSHNPPSSIAVTQQQESCLLAEISHLKNYPKNSFVYVSKDSNSGVWVLEHGFVRLGVYTETGDEMTTDVLKPGDLFGNFTVHDTDEAEFARALTDVQVRCIDQSTYCQMSYTRPQLSNYFTNLICARLHQLKWYFVVTTSLQVRERIVTFFRFLADYCGTPREQEIVIDNFLTHQDIAGITNTTRQTVTKLLLEFQEEGALLYSRKKITLLSTFPTTALTYSKFNHHASNWHVST